MKVVVICSSPRIQGNSEILADQFIKGAKEKGHEVEKINIAYKKIAPCLACEYCRNHDQVCFQKDDANEVIQKIIDSDVFVFTAPVYFYSLPAQLKLLIDRFFAREYEIRKNNRCKKAYLIVTSGTPDKDSLIGVIESFRGFIKVLRTVDEGGIVYGTGAFLKGDALNHPAFDEAYKMGLNL